MNVKVKVYFISFFLFVLFIFIFIFIIFNIRYPLRYKEAINYYSAKYNISAELVASLINEESSFLSNSKSNKGAIGLMQILPSTAEYIATQLLHEEYNDSSILYNPDDNIKYGCCYIAYLKSKFKDEISMLCAYNAGETTVLRWLKEDSLSRDGVTLSNIPYAVTKNYVNKIIRGKRYYLKRI